LGFAYFVFVHQVHLSQTRLRPATAGLQAVNQGMPEQAGPEVQLPRGFVQHGATSAKLAKSRSWAYEFSCALDRDATSLRHFKKSSNSLNGLFNSVARSRFCGSMAFSVNIKLWSRSLQILSLKSEAAEVGSTMA